MSQIIWDDSFSVNNDEIDNQHKKWIEIYNYMDFVMCSESYHVPDRLKALKAMKDYTQYHFSFEEEYLYKINYPYLIGHRRIHKEFDNLIYTYYRKVLENEIVLNSEVISILKEWIFNHILNEDKQYKLYLEVENKLTKS